MVAVGLKSTYPNIEALLKLKPNTECKTSRGVSICEVMRLWGSKLDDSPVRLATSHKPLTWAALRVQLDYVRKDSGSLGEVPVDRIAGILTDGLALAVAFLTVPACATFASLNPVNRQAQQREAGVAGLPDSPPAWFFRQCRLLLE